MKGNTEAMAFLFDASGNIKHAQGPVNVAQAEFTEFLTRKDRFYKRFLINKDDDGNIFGIIYYETSTPYNVFEW